MNRSSFDLLGIFMKKFLCFFVSALCFAGTDIFGVPLAWESFGNIYKVSRMNDPSAVCSALRKCEVVEDDSIDLVEIVNSDEDRINCTVGAGRLRPGNYLLSFDYNEEPMGEVFFVEGNRLEVAQVGSQSVFYEPDPFFVRPDLQRRRYYAGKECFTVRRFFGDKVRCLDHNKEMFVSATIYYDDLKSVEIRCGWGFLGFRPSHAGERIGELKAVSDTAEEA